MAKLTNEAISELLKAKGLTVPADNPNLVTIARSLGVMPTPAFKVRAFYNVAKAKGTKEIPAGKYDAPNALANGFLAIKPTDGGQDAWVRVAGPETKLTRKHVESLIEVLQETADELPADDE